MTRFPIERVSTARLWPVRIVSYRLDRGPEWNDELAAIVDDFVESRMKHCESGFKHTLPWNILTHYRSRPLTELFDTMQEVFWAYVGEQIGLAPADITPPAINMFANRERRGEWCVPHTHHGNQVVITYYPKVVRAEPEPMPLAGNVVFHMPTPSVPGYWARRENAFTPFCPETGTLIAFPGNAEHSTFPFFEPGNGKWSLVSNWRFAAAYEGEASAYEKCDAITAFQAGGHQ